MKSRQRSSLKLNRRLPDCHSFCVPPVIDHLGADLSFTAVIPVKCRAIHQPTPVAGGQVHHAAPVRRPSSPPQAPEASPNKSRASCGKGKEQDLHGRQVRAQLVSQRACAQTQWHVWIVKDSIPLEGCGSAFFYFVTVFFPRMWRWWTSH